MNDADSVKLLELLASKICHDLISPVGAISNGIEILEELGDAGDDVTSLIAFSANQANAKLKTMRMVYGIGGNDATISVSEIHQIFSEYISGESRLSQNWDPHTALAIEPKEGLAKILLSLLILAIDALPKGGVLSVESGDENTIVITGEGENAHFRDGHVHALERKTDISDLTPHLVHAYVTGLCAPKYGFAVEVDETKNNFIFLRLKSTDVSL